MATKGELTRARMVEAANRLFQQQGYAATGLQQILAESEAPRGSLYFHFRGGKEELAEAVIEQHAEAFGQALAAVAEGAPDAVTAARFAVEALAQQVEGSACAAGCPVGTIALEMATQSERLQRASRGAFERWREVIAARLRADGFAPADADARAMALLAGIEGALVLCRAYDSRAPLDALADTLPFLLRP